MQLTTKQISLILFTLLFTLVITCFYVLPMIIPHFLLNAPRLTPLLEHRFLFFLSSAFLLLYIDHFTVYIRGTLMRWITNISALLWFASFIVAYLSHPIFFLMKNL